MYCIFFNIDLIADLLFEKLGGLPLALEQACAYIKYLRCTLSDYLESYNKQSLQLLKKKKASSPCSTSEDRLAVHTTWLLNFEHIRKNENGMVAIRFLNATAFMNPNEIQKELINVGKPHVDDKAYCDNVSSSLGSLEVLRLLTDFSLFKETCDSSLIVHRLVQEVIRENLEPEEKVESIVDAARLLGFAFSNCPSPDELVESVVSEDNDRSSLHSTDPSRFYKWHKICLHAYEIKKNLEKFLYIFCDAKQKTVFLSEVARIVYECALHLNVNNYTSEAKTVAEFANRILDWGDDKISEEGLKALFPHTFPLTESFRRLIQYSCKAPLDTSNPGTSKASVNDSMKSEIEEMRLKGNNLFKESNFQEAKKIYSSCIDRSQRTDSFDPKLLSNRASAYLRLKQFNNALNDAEEYMKYSPECWRGYAKKALALQGLDEKWNAVCAAALAFYHDRHIFEHFPPFQTSFPNLKQSIHVCDDVSSLVFLLSQLPCEIVSYMPSKVIVLEPGKYCLSVECFDRFRVVEDNIFNVKLLRTGGFCLVAASDGSPELSVTLSFAGNFGLLSHSVMAVNISFIFELGKWQTMRGSVVKLFDCSVTSNIFGHTFVSEGSLSVKKCHFINCKSTALLVCGNADVEDSVFSGNESIGLQVVGPGNLVLKDSKLHGNQWGLDVKHALCDVTGCQIYDNKKIGVGVGNGRVKLTRNEIFHNDRHGIYLCEKSSAVIEENEIFENGWWGIDTMSNASCQVSQNKIYLNKCGGIHIDPIIKASDHKQSIIEFNKIFSNQGPGIDQDKLYDDKIGGAVPSLDVLLTSEENFMKAKCTENTSKNNVERESEPPSQDVPEICFFCHKQDQLKKCTKCFTAGYCNPECQRSDWERHKKNCARLLEKYSVLLNILPLSVGLIGDKQVLNNGVEVKAPFPWLEQSGPEYEEAPKCGKRFIVKIQACDLWRRSNNRGTLLAIQDRSLTINGDLDVREHSGRISHLVRECGSNCNSEGWKKKFFWALLAEDEMVRVFIGDFPTFRRW
jgi:parallel beta-helix repeat protein